MKCRLLYVVGQLGAGGLERQLCYLLQSMDRERYQPAVFVWSPSERDIYTRDIRALGVPVYAFRRLRSPIAKLRALRCVVKRLRPEVVHSYTFYTNCAAWCVTRSSKTFAIGSVRNSFILDRRRAGKILGRLSARWPRFQIANSHAASKEAEQLRGLFKPARLECVTNGLDIQRFTVRTPLPAKVTLLAIGRLYPQKRWDRLVTLTAALSAMGFDFSVRHVGNGPLLQALQEQASSLGVDRLIQFLGARRDIVDLLAAATVLIHTADDEGCPNVVMEAMACGRAVVATDAGDVPTIVEDGTTGFIVKRGDEKMLVERVAMLIRDHNLCASMGRAGRLKAERTFGLHRLASDTLAAYECAGWQSQRS